MDKAFILYNENYSLPKITKATPGSSCYDLYADNIENAHGETLFMKNDQHWSWSINPFCHHVVTCGFKLILPTNYEAQIRSRSGLAAKQQLFVLNSPGTIDSDYRGEVKVILMNLNGHPLEINKGMKVAQMKIVEYNEPSLSEITEEQFKQHKTERGSGGFGSTGN